MRFGLISLCLFAVSLAVAAEPDIRVAQAAQAGDREAVRRLIAQHADVNTALGDGSTALHWAASRDDLAMARLLLATGAKPNARSRVAGLTPLFAAATNGSAEMIELLAKAGADVNAADSVGATAL